MGGGGGVVDANCYCKGGGMLDTGREDKFKSGIGVVDAKMQGGVCQRRGKEKNQEGRGS